MEKQTGADLGMRISLKQALLTDIAVSLDSKRPLGALACEATPPFEKNFYWKSPQKSMGRLKLPR